MSKKDTTSHPKDTIHLIKVWEKPAGAGQGFTVVDEYKQPLYHLGGEPGFGVPKNQSIEEPA